jgi:hypothetical protein
MRVGLIDAWQRAIAIEMYASIEALPSAARSRPNRAMKARLLDDADHYDELAAEADRAGTEAEKP